MAALAVVLAVAACGEISQSAQDQSMDEASTRASQHRAYVPHNMVEQRQIDRRQEIADDPTTILWCSFAFPIAGSEIVTVPIVGKLTSGNKRTIPTEQSCGDFQGCNPELPGQDGTYGSSGEYRFGFDPSNNYHDFYMMPTYCTSEPHVFRRQQSGMILSVVDASMLDAHNRARAALRAGLQQDGSISAAAMAEANRILGGSLVQAP